MADEYLEGIMNRQSPAMTAQDVDRVISELRAPRSGQAVDVACALDDLCIKAASLLESQAQALSEATGQADTYCKWWREQRDRALAAESRLAEAMRVIEPFALIAEHDVSSIETDADTYQPMTYNTVPNISIGMLRAARDFLNAAKEKT